MASDALWVVSFKCVVKGYQECRFDVKDGEVFNVLKKVGEKGRAFRIVNERGQLGQLGHPCGQGFLLLNKLLKNARKPCFRKVCFVCIGLPEPIERNPFNCVRISSVTEPNRTQSD